MKWYSLLFFFFFLPVRLQADDFQLWSEVSIKAPLSSSWEVQIDSTARFRNHARKAFLYFIEVDLTKKCTCDWFFSLGYRHFYKLNDADRWIHEPTPLVFCIKKWKWSEWAFSHRYRIEYRTRSHGPWLFRTRLEIEWPLEWNFINFLGCCVGEILGKWRPYAHEEAFFQEGKGFNQNRIQVGIRKKIKRDDKRGGVISIAYLWKEERTAAGLWDNTDVLRFKFEWSF